MSFQKSEQTTTGFTLVELLVVIAIIAILTVTVIAVINPVDLLKKTRNSRRLSDLGEVRKALDVAIANASGSGSPFQASALGDSCNNSQSATGNGWIPYDNTQINLQQYLSSLPRDPVNSNGQCYYFRAGADGTKYKLSVPLENAGDAATTMQTDGGADPNRYEIGSDVTIAD